MLVAYRHLPLLAAALLSPHAHAAAGVDMYLTTTDQKHLFEK
eukprot:gene269-19890_t